LTCTYVNINDCQSANQTLDNFTLGKQIHIFTHSLSYTDILLMFLVIQFWCLLFHQWRGLFDGFCECVYKCL